MTPSDLERSKLVNFGPDPFAPEAPSVGIALALGESRATTGKLRAFDAFPLHGAFSADTDLIWQCQDGLHACILLTIHRLDKPWGNTGRLHSSKVSAVPALPPNEYRPAYRQRGQFQVDLKAFFGLTSEPGRYTVFASIGAHFSNRVVFEVTP